MKKRKLADAKKNNVERTLVVAEHETVFRVSCMAEFDQTSLSLTLLIRIHNAGQVGCVSHFLSSTFLQGVIPGQAPAVILPVHDLVALVACKVWSALAVFTFHVIGFQEEALKK